MRRKGPRFSRKKAATLQKTEYLKQRRQEEPGTGSHSFLLLRKYGQKRVKRRWRFQGRWNARKKGWGRTGNLPVPIIGGTPTDFFLATIGTSAKGTGPHRGGRQGERRDGEGMIDAGSITGKKIVTKSQQQQRRVGKRVEEG